MSVAACSPALPSTLAVTKTVTAVAVAGVPTVPSSPTVMPTPTSSPTASPTPTPTHTATPVPSDTPTLPATAPVMPSSLEGELWREEVQAEPRGISMRIEVVTGQSLGAREWFPIERIELNREDYPDAASRLAEMALRAHWHAWVSDDPAQRGQVSFEEYAERLRRGEDLTYQVFFPAGAEGRPASALTVDPRKPLALVYTDEAGPLYLAEGQTFSLEEGALGGLRIAIQLPEPVRRYYDRYYAENPQEALAYYTSYALNPATAFKLLSLGEEFQRRGTTTAAGREEAARLAACAEFRDVDDLAYPCDEAGHQRMRYRSIFRAVLREGGG